MKRPVNLRTGEHAVSAASDFGAAYRALLELSSQAMLLVAADGNIVYANDALAQLVGCALTDLVGQPVRALWCDVELGRRSTSESSTHQLRRRDGSTREVAMTRRQLALAGGALYAVVLTDLATERSAHGDVREAFLLKLADALRPLADPIAIEREATRILGEHLQAFRVQYADVRADGATLHIHADYCATGARSTVGVHRVERFGPTLVGAFRSGQRLVFADVTQDPEATESARLAYAALQITAYAAVPLVKDGRASALLVVHSDVPRQWTQQELLLVEETAERTWAAVERARSEAALREHQERLHFALDAAKAGQWILEPATGEFIASQQALALHGLSAAAVRDHAAALAAVHPDDRARVAAALQHTLQTGAAFSVEMRAVLPDGGVRWLSSRAMLHRDGGSERLIGFVQDFTERKRVEEALRQTQAQQAFLLRLGDALRASSDVDAVLTSACGMLAEHCRAARVLYFEVQPERPDVLCVRRELVREPLASALGEHACSDFGAELIDCLRHGQLAIPDVQHDPRTRAAPALASLGCRALIALPAPQAGRSLSGLMLQATAPHAWNDVDVALVAEASVRIWDAVERARAEAALRDSETRLRLAWEATREVLWDWDALRDEQRWSAAVADVYGWREVVEQPQSAKWWLERVHEDDRERVTAGISAALRDPARLHWEERYRFQRASGAYAEVHDRGFVLRDERGKPLRVVGAMLDLTERKAAEAVLLSAAREKDEFIAVLAHELRNPLAPIRTAVGLLHAHPAMEHDLLLQRCREIIERQTAQMARLLDDLLDVSRLSRGKLTLQRERVRLQDVLEAAVETAQPIIAERRHELLIEPGAPVSLDADAARLTQVFANLLNNAAKYTEPGGRIALRVHARQESVTVSVSDTGMGIEPSLRDRVFNLFTQAGSARERTQGLGIGLGLSRRLVELHGGSIAAQSEGIGRGSEFSVSLPLPLEWRELGTRSRDSKPPLAALGGRVLVADDNEDAADMVAMLLERRGCEVRTVYGGEAAVHEAQRFQPDLVLLDLGMPGVTGQDACRMIRSEPWGARIKIAALTGWGQQEDRRQTRSAGFDEHLVKPVDPEDLVQLVRACCRAR